MSGKRWPFLEHNPAVSYPGWFPPKDECAELADLRAEHLRLLAARGEAYSELADLRRQQEREADEHGRALTAALLAGEEAPPPPSGQVTERELADALLGVEAANDALQAFARTAVQGVVDRAPQVQAGVAARLRLADEKRAEARAFLAEADRLAAEPTRLRDWIARATGESPLGLVPFDHLGLPMRPPVPEVIEEIARLRPGEAIDLGSDDASDGTEVMSRAG